MVVSQFSVKVSDNFAFDDRLTLTSRTEMVVNERTLSK